MALTREHIDLAYALAKERFAELNVDTNAAIERLRGISISLHCWQGDDVGGFEGASELGGGLAVTGNYPGKARTADELRSDLDLALRLIPGRHRVNLHAMYAETGGKRVERTDLEPKHFQRWIDWAKSRGLGSISIPPFSPIRSPKVDSRSATRTKESAATGSNTASPAGGSARRWAESLVRRVSRMSGFPMATRTCPSTAAARANDSRNRSMRSLPNKSTTRYNLDAVESKLFGIGSESYVVGSHEFYLGYAIGNDEACFASTRAIFIRRNRSPTRFRPCSRGSTRLLLHVSRGVRWDSDHVVILSDELRAMMQEVVRGDYLDRTHIGLDFFDASINRVAAWVIGTRATLKALLLALLEPIDMLRKFETSGDFTSRLAALEQLEHAAVRRRVGLLLCCREGVPDAMSSIDDDQAV